MADQLSVKSVERLCGVLERPKSVHSASMRGPLTKIEVDLKKLIVCIRNCLKKHTGICVDEIRLGGGVASYVVCDGIDDVIFNDIDFVFKIGGEIVENQLHSIRSIVLQCFNNCNKQSDHNFANAFVSKTVKVWNAKDKWSLISLGATPLNVDLIFVSKMARNYQFSVDSFQIILDPILIEHQPSVDDELLKVYAESGYGDVNKAIGHVQARILATNAPETIRGGGLLRYCDLLAKGFKTANGKTFDIKLEQIMCTRFFIDFASVVDQAKEIDRYLRNHFEPTDDRKCNLLRQLVAVIQRSSLCIMNQERRLVLAAIATFLAREAAIAATNSHNGLTFSRSI